MRLYIGNMAKFKSDLLNKLSEKPRGNRARKAKTLYLHGENFEKFKKILKPLSPSEVIDAYMEQVIEAEKNKK